MVIMGVRVPVWFMIAVCVLAAAFFIFLSQSGQRATPIAAQDNKSATSLAYKNSQPTEPNQSHAGRDYELVDIGLVNAEPVHAKAIYNGNGEVVAGALICPSYDETNFLLNQYILYGEELGEDRRSLGRSVLIRGRSMTEPNPAAYSCFLVPAGTPMQLSWAGLIPIVKAEMPNGDTIKGVTQTLMVEFPPKLPAANNPSIDGTPDDPEQSQQSS